MRKRPELDLPDYVQDRRTGAADILCGLGVAVGIVLMLAIVGPRGLEPGTIEALLEQPHRSFSPASKIANRHLMLFESCPASISA